MKLRPQFLAVIVTGIIACIFCLWYVIPFASVVWDEALAQSWVYIIYAAFKQRSADLFAYGFYKQIVYPPLFSIMYAAPSFIFSEFSIQNARTGALLWFLIAGLLTYALGKKTDSRFGPWIGMVSAMLMFTSPLFLVHASIGLREVVAVCCTLLFFISYLQIYSKRSFRWLIGAIISLFLLAGIKYQYPMFALAPVFIDIVYRMVTHRPVRSNVISVLVITVPTVIAVLLWMYFPTDKSKIIIDIFRNTFNYTGGRSWWFYVSLIPNTVIHMYSAFPIIGYGILIGFVGSLYEIQRNPAIRILWLSFIANWAIALTHTNNIQERYVMLTVPMLFIVASFAIVRGLDSIKNRFPVAIFSGKFRIVWLLGIIVSIAIGMKEFPRSVYAVGSISLKSPAFNQLDYKDVWFDFDRNSWPKAMPWQSKESPQNVLDFLMDNIDLSHEFTVYGRPGELSPDLINITTILHRLKNDYPKLPYPKMAATIEVLPGSRYYTHDFQMLNAWRISEIKTIRYDPDFKMLKQKNFSELGMIVTIYGQITK